MAIPHAHSGSGFVAEPPEWFPRSKQRDRLLFTHKDPNVVLHLKSRRCKYQFPHKTKDCGHFDPAKEK